MIFTDLFENTDQSSRIKFQGTDHDIGEERYVFAINGNPEVFIFASDEDNPDPDSPSFEEILAKVQRDGAVEHYRVTPAEQQAIAKKIAAERQRYLDQRKPGVSEAMKPSDIPPSMRKRLTMRDIERERPEGAFRFRVTFPDGHANDYMTFDAAQQAAEQDQGRITRLSETQAHGHKKTARRSTARIDRILQLLRARNPQAQNDLEALILDFRGQQAQDRTDIARLDAENDMEEADIERLEAMLAQLKQRRTTAVAEAAPNEATRFYQQQYQREMQRHGNARLAKELAHRATTQKFGANWNIIVKQPGQPDRYATPADAEMLDRGRRELRDLMAKEDVAEAAADSQQNRAIVQSLVNPAAQSRMQQHSADFDKMLSQPGYDHRPGLKPELAVSRQQQRQQWIDAVKNLQHWDDPLGVIRIALNKGITVDEVLKNLPAGIDLNTLREQEEGVAESLRDREYHVATVTLDDGTTKKVRITTDEGFRDSIKRHFERQGRQVTDIDVDYSVRSELDEAKKKPQPTNPELWGRAKAAARSKFDVYPSAYANAWAAKYYKSKGGGWRMGKPKKD